MAQTQPQNPPLRRFACPFFKANPRYAVSTRCTETGWVRIDHLKRHIRLVHVRDEKDCSQDLSEPEEAFITDFEKVALPAGFGNRSGEEAWRHMYKVLFPSAETVPSPYHETPTELQKQQLRQRGQQLLQELQQQHQLGQQQLGQQQLGQQQLGQQLLQELQQQQQQQQHALMTLMDSLDGVISPEQFAEVEARVESTISSVLDATNLPATDSTHNPWTQTSPSNLLPNAPTPGEPLPVPAGPETGPRDSPDDTDKSSKVFELDRTITDVHADKLYKVPKLDRPMTDVYADELYNPEFPTTPTTAPTQMQITLPTPGEPLLVPAGPETGPRDPPGDVHKSSKGCKLDRTMTDVYADELYNPEFPTTPTTAPTQMQITLPTNDMFVHPVDHSVHDSGYGSSAARSVAIGKLDTVQGREEAAHTFNVFDATEEAYETATVFSDAASLLQRPDTNKHISWFVYELACCIPLEFGMRNAGNVPSILDHFLRSFAIRLGHANAPRPQRQLMYLVYRFRQSVISLTRFDLCREVSDIELRGSDIIKRLLRTLDAQNDCDIDSLNTGSHGNGGEIRDANLGMSLAEKVSMMWDKESNDIGSGEMDDALDDLEDDPVELDAERHILTEYREMLLDSSAYKWLQSTIRVRSTLQVPERDATITYHNIGDQIIKASAAGSPVQFSRKHTQQLCMIFTIDWDLFAFSREQQYDKPLSLVLAHAITLTGYGNNLLATTCQDYLRQTWPETGSALLSLLQQAADGGPARAVFSDSTRLTANFRNGKLYLNAVGNVFSIAEVAEQIAWIAAALRSSPSDEEAAYSTPHIDGFRIDNILGGDQIYIIGSCRVGFKMHIIHDSELAKAGKCWRGMFGNPVIVRGYPIPCRPEADTGLEISLDVVAGLTNCQRVVNFANTTFIKGFAAMLAAVRVIGDIVLWHLCYNPEGKYISYEDERAQRSPRTHTLSMGTLQRSRHIIGWSDSVKNYAGAPDADYDIERSELPSPGSSCVFEKITVSGSAIPFITPGASFIVGVKDKPLHLGFGRDNYVGTLMTLRQRHVVFYDSEEKRGWLVNGVCAVLHLLRAYLKFCTEDDCISSCFMYSDGDIEEASRCAAYTGAKAAFEILTNPSNQSIPLYARQSTLSEEHTARLGKKLDADATTLKTTSSNFTLKEKVDEICHILLQITAYYDDVGTQAGFGFRIRSSPRHLVEGFEFKDVAIRNDTLWPKVAKIQTGSVGWVHLIRSLRAVTLFGDGFGELFRPAWSENQTQACCSPTSLVPKGKDFLAVYGADLENMLTAKSKRRNPWRLAENIYWHSPDGVAFQSCECKTATPRGEMDTSTTKRKGKGLRGFFGLEHEGHADQPRAKNPGDRVQVLLPTTFPQLYGRGLRSPAEVVSRGAVLFGHSWKFPLRWSLTKDIPPEEGEPDPPSIDEVSNLVSDSGLGTSIGSSPLGDDKPTPTTTPPHPLYSLGSNTGFVHRGDSLSSGVGEVTAPSESSGEGIKGSRTAVPDFNASKKRPVDMLGTEEFGTAAKVRRL